MNEYQLLMAAITGVMALVERWKRTAEEIRESETAGTPVSAELRAKAKEASDAAQAMMNATL